MKMSKGKSREEMREAASTSNKKYQNFEMKGLLEEHFYSQLLEPELTQDRKRYLGKVILKRIILHF